MFISHPRRQGAQDVCLTIRAQPRYWARASAVPRGFLPSAPASCWGLELWRAALGSLLADQHILPKVARSSSLLLCKQMDEQRCDTYEIYLVTDSCGLIADPPDCNSVDISSLLHHFRAMDERYNDMNDNLAPVML
jgi:hypothetical protein